MVLSSSPAGPVERPLLRGTGGSTVAGTEVGTGGSSGCRASLSVAEADGVWPDVDEPQKAEGV